MKSSGRWLREFWQNARNAWDLFWFQPRAIDVLACIRIATGAMLLYSHLVLLSDYGSFVGNQAWIDQATAKALHDGSFGVETAAWSYLWNIRSSGLLYAHHLLAIVAAAAMMLGVFSRFTVPLAWFLQLMLVHRLIGSLFGLDQIVTYLAMYLSLTTCGAVWSIDAWWRDRKRGGEDSSEANTPASRLGKWLLPEDRPTVAANIATRLLQLHLCVIYLFGGLAKARGEMWWDGTAFWYAIGNLEYQSLDVTFLASYPRFFTALTHVTLFWEVFYCALVWPRATRPLTIAVAFAVHGGIALFLGMATFGTMMIVANCIFISPEFVRRWRRRNQTTEATAEIAIESTGKSIRQREAELELAEQAFKKRYKKLKAREAKVDDRNQRLKATKAKIRERIEEGVITGSDSQLNHLIAEEPHDDIDDDPLGQSSGQIL